MTNEEIKMLLMSRLDKKANNNNNKPFLKNSLEGISQGSKIVENMLNSNPQRLKKDFINFLSEYTPEGIKLKTQFSRTAPNISLADIRRNASEPITDSTHMAYDMPTSRLKALPGTRYHNWVTKKKLYYPWNWGKISDVEDALYTKAKGLPIANNSTMSNIFNALSTDE